MAVLPTYDSWQFGRMAKLLEKPILKSFNSNRPPDYPPTLPPPPSLPHHSTQQSWHQQHSNQSFSSPSHSGGGSVHHDYYSSTTNSTSSPSSSFQPSSMPTSMTAHERNNNEPSMVSPSRYNGSSGGMHGIDTSRSNSMPQDPREWSANDVIRWIQWASITFKLRNLHPERFQMNGKALCLMDLSMFLYRVPDGGERLYQDFQGRLQKALCQDKMR